MPRLAEAARIVRSKNAGPYTITIDVIFDSLECFEKAVERLTPELIAVLYKVDASQVEIIPYKPALAVKINIPREVPAGHPGDRDVYGAQQHAPLLEAEVDLECM